MAKWRVDEVTGKEGRCRDGKSNDDFAPVECNQGRVTSVNLSLSFAKWFRVHFQLYLFS